MAKRDDNTFAARRESSPLRAAVGFAGRRSNSIKFNRIFGCIARAYSEPLAARSTIFLAVEAWLSRELAVNNNRGFIRANKPWRVSASGSAGIT